MRPVPRCAGGDPPCGTLGQRGGSHRGSPEEDRDGAQKVPANDVRRRQRWPSAPCRRGLWRLVDARQPLVGASSAVHAVVTCQGIVLVQNPWTASRSTPRSPRSSSRRTSATASRSRRSTRTRCSPVSPPETLTPASSCGRRASPPTSRPTSTRAPSSNRPTRRRRTDRLVRATLRPGAVPRDGDVGGLPRSRGGQPVRQRRNRRSRALPGHRPVVLTVRRGDHRKPRAAAAGGLLRLGSGHRRRPRLGGRCRGTDPDVLVGPHGRRGKYDLVQVELPEYTDECYADPAAIACAYPEDVLVKIASAQLADKDPAVNNFLAWFTLTNEDQSSMLPAVEIDGEPRRDRRPVGRRPRGHVDRLAVRRPAAIGAGVVGSRLRPPPATTGGWRAGKPSIGEIAAISAKPSRVRSPICDEDPQVQSVERRSPYCAASPVRRRGSRRSPTSPVSPRARCRGSGDAPRGLAPSPPTAAVTASGR